MHIIIIGGFLGSGKTTTILKISRQLTNLGKRTAIIVNEIGEIGLDGDILTSPGIKTEELTSGCICCTLRISMQYTLQTLEEEFKPDVIIIEPTGIAFPGQIREEIETMGVSELSFAPIITLVDPGRFGTEAKEIPKFIETQIKEAQILGINKIDAVSEEIINSTEEMLHELNPEAQILRFSAKLGDEQFKKLLFNLTTQELKKADQEPRQDQERKNSIEMSDVSAYSTLYNLTLNSSHPEKGVSFIEDSLKAIQEKLKKINPEFIGHVKLSLKLPDFTVKGGLVSSDKSPEIDVLNDRKNKKIELRALSAITKVPKDELVGILEGVLEEKLSRLGVIFEKKLDKKENKDIVMNIVEYKRK